MFKNTFIVNCISLFYDCAIHLSDKCRTIEVNSNKTSQNCFEVLNWKVSVFILQFDHEYFCAMWPLLNSAHLNIICKTI